ncbi:MAG: metallophosphoesterase [Bacteroidales bacterium]|nr:metallophosphoesterase [Bacteroidales bacterium]
MKRRDVLKTLGITGALASMKIPLAAGGAFTDKTRSLRIIQLTDIHLQPENQAPEGLRKTFAHIRQNYPNADLIINTGDVIMDALEEDRQRVQKQWDLWHEISSKETGLPIENCIGNHDIWGGGELTAPDYGKAWAMKALGLSHRYRSFDRGNWHFIVLDSTQIDNSGQWYTAYLDQEQMNWLVEDLENTSRDKSILVMSHIPILTSTVFFTGDSDSANSGSWHFPKSWMHGDARRISELFENYQNVKIAVSGHMHMVDRVDFKGVSYLCNGAVSGNWWKGAHYGFQPGYAVIDLFEDGSFENTYVAYE